MLRDCCWLILETAHFASSWERLKGDGKAVELEVDEVALSIASLAACGDVGTAGLLDGDGDCEENC